LAGEWSAFEREKTARRVLDAAVRPIPAAERRMSEKNVQQREAKQQTNMTMVVVGIALSSVCVSV